MREPSSGGLCAYASVIHILDELNILSIRALHNEVQRSGLGGSGSKKIVVPFSLSLATRPCMSSTVRLM